MTQEHTPQEMRDFGEDVRAQGRGSSPKDLVFDPVTGEFKQVDAGDSVSSGSVVTEMTKGGFAL